MHFYLVVRLPVVACSAKYFLIFMIVDLLFLLSFFLFLFVLCIVGFFFFVVCLLKLHSQGDSQSDFHFYLVVRLPDVSLVVRSIILFL